MLVLEKYNLRSRSQDQFQSLLSVDLKIVGATSHPTPPHNKNVQGQNFSFVSPGPERKFWDFFGKIWKVNKIVHVNKKVP